MKSDKSTDEQYCIYSGKRCVHCNRCDVPSYTIINNMPKSGWLSNLVICLLIFLIIFLLIMLIPYMMTNLSDNLMKEPIDNSYDNQIQLSNYESQNSYGGSDIQTYNNDPTTYISSQLPDGYFINTTGESYNSI